MVKLDSDCISITSKEINDKELALIPDKGEDNGKSASFVKLMVYYVSEEYGVKGIYFGIEIAGNSSQDSGCSIDHSVKVFEY